ncbi:MAG: hypothetical protein OSA84_11360 [Akkermansiaceae bacterium]|nr:hypothetical protein [Akkermansiaceae bacterium]
MPIGSNCAEKLDADTLVHAIQARDFYASTGLSLESVNFDPKTNILEIRIVGSDEESGKVTTKIHGTLRGEESDPAKVGKELASYDTRIIRHQLTGKEWFVRATVTSEHDHPRLSFSGQKQKAWTQPVKPTAK